jgi:hypothetical protein
VIPFTAPAHHDIRVAASDITPTGSVNNVFSAFL